MPELPEVETTVRGLKKEVLSRAFLDVWTDNPKMIRFCGKFKKTDGIGKLREKIRKKSIEKIWRRGKNLIFELSNNESLLIHQKLTGHLLVGKWLMVDDKWVPKKNELLKEPVNKHIHLVFWLDNGKQLALSDLRKFAKVEFWETVELEENLKKLGPEPLEKGFTFEKFKKTLENKKGKIKQVLMNQEVIVGIGNIYSDEALWRAGVHPERKTNNVTDKELKKLFETIKEVFKKGIELKGESFSDYRTIEGEKGNFDKERKVYRRKGEKCFQCGSEIKKIKMGGRSAHFCPDCQK